MAEISRRIFTVASLAAGAVTASSSDAGVQEDISFDNAAIHQEPVFHANPARIYRILTTDEFDKVVRLSAAMTSGMIPARDARPTMIDARPGGAFSFFGGYITGQNIEFVPDTRLVQVWRSANWDAGSYSIVRFGLVAQGGDTRIVFDHSGFPNADAPHLAKGWRDNYWQPLAKVLAQ